MSDPEADNVSPMRAGAGAGALTAAFTAFVLSVSLLILAAFLQPDDARGWLPVIFGYMLCSCAAAALPGAILGGLGAKTNGPGQGMLLGLLVGSLLFIVCGLPFALEGKPIANNLLYPSILYLLLFSPMVGAAAGCAGGLIGRRARRRRDRSGKASHSLM
jgi:hypothetical protein